MKIATDCVIFGFNEGDLKILLIVRGIEPFKGKWALPGGFLLENENADECAIRELKTETGVENVFMEQLYTFSTIDRDPRGRVISVAYYALVKQSDYSVKSGDDAAGVQWFSLNQIPELAFDHKLIVEKAINRLRGKIRYQPVGFELLPEKFTLSQLQHLYESVLEISIDKRNFRKKILKMNFLEETGEKQTNVAHKAGKFYKFNKEKYNELMKSGFIFEI